MNIEAAGPPHNETNQPDIEQITSAETLPPAELSATDAVHNSASTPEALATENDLRVTEARAKVDILTGTGESHEAAESTPLDAAYESFRLLEARAPNPQDRLTGVAIPPASPEYQTLRDAGVSEEQIRTGAVTREQLTNAGFFFVNRVGGGEKAFISAVLPDATDPEQHHDFRSRILLTRPELEAVYAYQQNHAEVFGLGGQDAHEVRKDMLSFLSEIEYEPAFASEEEFRNIAIPDEIDSIEQPRFRDGTVPDWETADSINDYWKAQVQQYISEHTGYDEYGALQRVKEQFAREYCPDLLSDSQTTAESNPFNDKKVRGIATRSEGDRAVKVRGQLSPFLESGFIFDHNIDSLIAVAPDDEQAGKWTRINTAVLHLAGGHPDFPGLSEMGGTDRDQTYIPIGTYVDKIFPKDAAERTQIHDREASAVNANGKLQLSQEATRRLIAAAKTYAEAHAAQPVAANKKQRFGRIRSLLSKRSNHSDV